MMELPYRFKVDKSILFSYQLFQSFVSHYKQQLMLLYRKKIIRKAKRCKQRQTNVYAIIFVDPSFTYRTKPFAQWI